LRRPALPVAAHRRRLRNTRRKSWRAAPTFFGSPEAHALSPELQARGRLV